jgi:hypothetical protein
VLALQGDRPGARVRDADMSPVLFWVAVTIAGALLGVLLCKEDQS